jgi:hypothetical protein
MEIPLQWLTDATELKTKPIHVKDSRGPVPKIYAEVVADAAAEDF